MNFDAGRMLCVPLPGVTEVIKWDDDLVSSVGGGMCVVANLGR
jgi:hypothetical protein